MDKFEELLNLPGTQREQAWLKERLETLSVLEGVILSASLQEYPPQRMAHAITLIQFPATHEICFPAGNYEQLGKWCLLQEAKVPEDALPYIDLEQMGIRYHESHIGVFAKNCFVETLAGSCGYYDGDDSALPEDNNWSVKLKLASPAVPKGVWLRLPCYDGKMFYDSDEVILALHELKAESLEDCTLLEARCILPEAGDLAKQYDSITELVGDGDSLGYILDEQSHGTAHLMERFAAALEYEDCRTLKFALDISQNLHCYDWVPSEGIADFAAKHLRSCGVSEELIQSGSINLEGYGADLLETSGYMQASGDMGYLNRNGQEFIREYTLSTEKVSQDMTMQ